MSLNTSTCSSSNLFEEMKYLIKKSGLTQEKLAKELGCSRKVLNRQLNDPYIKKDYDLIHDICKKLGIRAIIIE